MKIAALNDISIVACDIQNTYLTEPYRENIRTVAGSEFGSDAVKNMLIV